MANREKYSSFILFKYDYWQRNQIYKRYLEFFEKIGGQLYDNTKSDFDVYRKLLDVRANQSQIDVLSVNYPRHFFKLKSRFYGLKISKCIIVADGFGYYGDFISKLASYRRERGFFKFLLMSLPIIIVNSLRFILSFFIEYEEYALLRKGDCTLNGVFLEDIKNIFLSMNTSSIITKPTLLFADQPLVELGILDVKQYLDMLEMLNVYARASGLDFLVKRHPATKHLSSNFKQLDFDGLLEELCLMNSNIKIAVSHSSTGLFNLQYMTNCKVMKTYDKSNIYLSKKQKLIYGNIPTYKN